MATDLRERYRAHVARLQDGYGKALVAAGLDAVVISSGALRAKSPFDDQDFPFRPTPTFAHWLPLLEANCALVVRPGQQPLLLRAAEPGYWEGPTPVESDHFWDSFEVRDLAMSEVAAALPSGRVGFVGDVTDHATAWGIDPVRANPPALIAALDAIRAIKDDYERDCIAAANRRAAAGHRAVAEAFRAGEASELELHLLYLRATHQDDAETPYKGIVALGEHAAVLHHVHYGRGPAAAETSLLVDAGATTFGYASDITRTYVKGTSDSARTFTALVAGVETIQQELCRRVVPGLDYQALHDQCHELLAPLVRELGLADASDDELVASGTTRALLPHGLGHSLGIQVHDVGCKLTPPRSDNPHLRNTTTITDGQVFTIEPGCYFIPSLLEPLRAAPIGARIDWSVVDSLRPYGGVRIEDNLAVTASGSRNLTRDNWNPSH